MMHWITGLDPCWEGVSIPKEHWHFLRRLWDRYHLTLEPGEFSQITRAIRSGNAVQVVRLEGKRAVYRVHLKRWDQRIYIVAAGDVVVTAMVPRRVKELRRRARAARS